MERTLEEHAKTTPAFSCFRSKNPLGEPGFHGSKDTINRSKRRTRNPLMEVFQGENRRFYGLIKHNQSPLNLTPKRPFPDSYSLKAGPSRCNRVAKSTGKGLTARHRLGHGHDKMADARFDLIEQFKGGQVVAALLLERADAELIVIGDMKQPQRSCRQGRRRTRNQDLSRLG